MAKDRDYIELINSQRWRELRRLVLNARPLCEDCLAAGLSVAASEVHHVTPVEYGADRAEKRRLAYDPHNLRALCHDCHVKAHVLLGRTGKAAAKRIAAERSGRAIKKLFGDTEDGGQGP